MTSPALRIALVAALLGSSGCATTAPEAGPAAPPVAGTSLDQARAQVSQGVLQGARSPVVEGVQVFRGIPFAAPPVGDLRWEMPRAPAAWQGVRDATRWGDNCVQNPAPQRFPVNSATDMPDSPGRSEDCLYLNVWTPAETTAERLPVMVWVYGGAYNEGGGSAPFSHGDYLAARGAVVVTLNYRVGSLGFMAHPELTARDGHSGNQALGDVLAALRWVQGNIASFGGDPARVTIFGESAGSAINAALAGSPEASGLITRVIAESGTWQGLNIGRMVEREAAEARSMATAQERFGTTSLAALRALPAEQVHAQLPGQGMIVDGLIVPEDLTRTFAAGRQLPVDVLTGSNEDEGSFTAIFGPPATLESWNAGEVMRWGELAEQGRVAYPVATDEEARATATQPFGDNMTWLHRQFAQWQAARGNRAFHYWFRHDPPYDEGRGNLGAAHTGEIPYVFDNLCAPRTFPGGSSVEQMCGNPREEAFADMIAQYWVNFAATGDPNGSGLPRWPEVDELSANQAFVLDADRTGTAAWISPDKIALYAALYRARVAQPLGVSQD